MALVSSTPHNSRGSHIGIMGARKGGVASSGMTFIPVLKLIRSQGDRYKGTMSSSLNCQNTSPPAVRGAF